MWPSSKYGEQSSPSVTQLLKVIRKQRLAHGRGLQSLLGVSYSTDIHAWLKVLQQQGCHFVRCGVEGLGTELQRR